MYSGTTLTPLSGRMVGAHQKIDRMARASLKQIIANNAAFPKSRRILHFEGVNGPDAIKRKSPAKDEPWHYISPFDDEDTQLLDLISGHYDQLVKALKADDEVRASFEAAWLAHAIVDGLTPAHHYPYEEKLTELRGGAGIETRTTIREKLVMHGENPVQQVRNNWKMWGPRGLMTTHGFFEFGIAAMLVPMSLKRIKVTGKEINELKENGVMGLFKRKAKEVAGMDLYEAYYARGWTANLAKKVRRLLIPIVVHTVALIWFAAMVDAGKAELPAEPAEAAKA